MKRFNLSTSSARALFLAIPICCLSAALIAAEKPTPAPAAPDAKPAPYDLEIVDGAMIRPGGKQEATLANVVDALRDRYTEANIIFSPGLGKLKVGDLKLRASRVIEQLEAVRVASGEKFEVQGGANAAIDPNTGLPTSSGLFVLREFHPPQAERIVEAFNLHPYLDWFRAEKGQHRQRHRQKEQALDEIHVMIDDAIHVLKEADENQPTFRYHSGATLLVVIGTADAVEVARKIIFALPGMSAGRDLGTPTSIHLPSRSAPAAQPEEPTSQSSSKK